MRLGRVVAVVAGFLLPPTVAFAQVTLAGTVKDASGAVLPGLTIEASSPVLIERIRTATSDAAGQYRIESLQPGTFAGPGPCSISLDRPPRSPRRPQAPRS